MIDPKDEWLEKEGQSRYDLRIEKLQAFVNDEWKMRALHFYEKCRRKQYEGLFNTPDLQQSIFAVYEQEQADQEYKQRIMNYGKKR